jgi:hypothetical protein
LEVWRLH